MSHNERINPIQDTVQFEYHLNQIAYALKPITKGFKAWPYVFSKNYLYEKTWTLVLGTAGSGKTSFLQQTELNVIQGLSEENEENSCCNTWFNQDGVFIELPSLDHENISLQNFLQTLKTHRHKKPFDNVLLTINLTAFIHDYDQYVAYLDTIKLQLQKTLVPFLSKETGLYIVFTHMDRIAGFCDFFAEFSTHHQTHALGYLLEDYSSKKKLIAQHEKKYDQLLHRLHENLVTLLHKTRNNLTRYLIREFPQQLESLRNMVRSSLSLTAEIHESTLKVKGVFFTSACQSGLCVDRLTLPISQSYQLNLPAHFPQARRHQPYFIKGVILMIAKNNAPRNTRFARYRREHKNVAYLGLMAVVLGLFFMGWGYYSSIQHIHKAERNLKHYQAFTQQFSQDNTLSTLIPELRYLAIAQQSLEEIKPWFIPLKALNQTKRWINAQYRHTLSEQFLPQLVHQLEEQLLHETNPAMQYATLKAYLMLGEPQYINLDYLKYWLSHTLHLSSEKILESALLQPFPGIALNPQLIDQVRRNLNSLPTDYFTYLLIKNDIQGNSSEFEPFNNDLFNSPLSSKKKISSFYTRRGFEQTYHQTIPNTLRHIISDNWILKNPNFSPHTLEELTQKDRELYTADYLNWWRLFIYHTQPKSFNTLDEAALFFKTITQSNLSSMIDMLTFIQSNTRAFPSPANSKLSPTLQLFNTQIATPLEAINTIPSQSFEAAAPALNALNRYFSLVATSPDKATLVFNTAKQKFMQPAQEGALGQLRTAAQGLPTPLNSWLQQIAANTWIVILNETKHTIDQAWKKQVLPEYTQNIANRFPLNTFGEQEISLNNFSHFFNANGTLPTFFETYIKPFLDTTQAQWSVKKVDGLGLPFSSDTLVEFVRANVIQAMFFPSNTATPSVHFVLQSTELQPIIKSIRFDINGQTLLASQTEKNTQAFNWPGDVSHIPVTLIIQSITGDTFQATEEGAWGLFRLMARANVFPIGHDTRKLQIILDVNGNAAQYLLQSSNPVNPFIPNILQNFQLSQDLFL